MDKLSNAQIIKEHYKNLLSDGMEHSRIELFAFAKANSGKNFTDGMMTGALRTLVTDTEDYICTRRGWYKKKSCTDLSNESNSIIDAYAEILNDALKKSKSITSDPFKIIKMSADEREKMEHIEKCIQVLTKTLDLIVYKS